MVIAIGNPFGLSDTMTTGIDPAAGCPGISDPKTEILNTSNTLP
jgi:S1-C subfamily serine protease